MRNPISDIVEEVEELAASSGAHAVLRFLNARTPHRFTGIYRFEGSMLRNLRLFDRENPALQIGADAPLRETYCSIVGQAQSPFITDDPREDPGLQAHPARESTLSYCGVLLRDERGLPFGTLCHFDLVPQRALRQEIPIMEAVAPLVFRAVERGTVRDV